MPSVLSVKHMYVVFIHLHVVSPGGRREALSGACGHNATRCVTCVSQGLTMRQAFSFNAVIILQEVGPWCESGYYAPAV